MRSSKILAALAVALLLALPAFVAAQIIGEQPRLDPNRPTQTDIEAGIYSLWALIDAGRIIFSTPFNRYDGYGDGPINPANTRDPGGRPALGIPWPEGVAMRVNGLDSSSCVDCHGQGSMRTIPPIPAVGGVGNLSNQVLARSNQLDIEDIDLDGIAQHNGRFINPPFNFGAGGVELLAKEMTRDLRNIAKGMWNRCVVDSRPLVTKGIYFGVLHLVDPGVVPKEEVEVAASVFAIQPPTLCILKFDFSDVVGINKPMELLVAPFGRKGDAFSIRNFDQGAMRFHFGMEPIELFPLDPDHDQDGVSGEIQPGDLSMLTIFQASLDRPVIEPLGIDGFQGYRTFIQIGCAYCHRPVLTTTRTDLPVSFPEVSQLFPNGGPAGGFGDPFGNQFFSVDLTVAGFPPTPFGGGVYVPLFADLKRHDMGERLQETSDETTAAGNRMFTTARLWGICDTEPYLHDGRAFTLHQAILRHEGEALGPKLFYEGLSEYEKNLILGFLCKLRTPVDFINGVPRAPGETTETTAETLLDVYNEEVAVVGENPAGV